MKKFTMAVLSVFVTLMHSSINVPVCRRNAAFYNVLVQCVIFRIWIRHTGFCIINPEEGNKLYSNLKEGMN